ncbi:MAG: PQQ-binding-like beta-propeller repeat protein, partial [bacterium]|nr:PQQ-binding-like beta-propeller repeat protein [bacterium]
MAMNGPAQSRPPIVPTTLGPATKVAFLGSQDGRAYAVDADTGQQLWASPQLPPAGSLIQASPKGSFATFGGIDRLMVGTRNSSADNQMHGLDLADGTIVWSFDNSVAQGGDGTGIGIISAGAPLDLANNRLYFASRARAGGSTDTVWCLSYSAGSVSKVWSRAIGDIDGATALYNGRIYAGTNTGQVHALDALTGADV